MLFISKLYISFSFSGRDKISVENKTTLLSEVYQSVTEVLYAN